MIVTRGMGSSLLVTHGYGSIIQIIGAAVIRMLGAALKVPAMISIQLRG